jgi:hypothetical protein
MRKEIMDMAKGLSKASATVLSVAAKTPETAKTVAAGVAGGAAGVGTMGVTHATGVGVLGAAVGAPALPVFVAGGAVLGVATYGLAKALHTDVPTVAAKAGRGAATASHIVSGVAKTLAEAGRDQLSQNRAK